MPCYELCRVIKEEGEDGERVLCDKRRHPKTLTKFHPRCKDCGGRKANDPNEVLAGK